MWRQVGRRLIRNAHHRIIISTDTLSAIHPYFNIYLRHIASKCRRSDTFMRKASRSVIPEGVCVVHVCVCFFSHIAMQTQTICCNPQPQQSAKPTCRHVHSNHANRRSASANKRLSLTHSRSPSPSHSLARSHCTYLFNDWYRMRNTRTVRVICNDGVPRANRLDMVMPAMTIAAMPWDEDMLWCRYAITHKYGEFIDSCNCN